MVAIKVVYISFKNSLLASVRYLCHVFLFVVFANAAHAVEENTNESTSLKDKITATFMSPLNGDLEIHTWDRYVRRFRRDHHIAVLTGYDQGHWQIGSVGSIRDQSVKSGGLDFTAQYTFHLQLYGKTGYLLGSSGGYYEEQRGARGDTFAPSSLWKLPGIVLGLVYNYDPTGRFTVGLEAYLGRFDNIGVRDERGERERLAVTGECYDLTFAWDVFFTLNAGLRLQYHQRTIWIPKPANTTGHLVDAQLNRKSRGMSLGGVYHFL